MIRHRLALLLSLVAAPAVLGQPIQPGTPPVAPPTPGQPEVQAPFLKVEHFDPALSGDEFQDETWNFGITLPKGFLPVAPAELAAIRKALIPDEAQRKLPSGRTQEKQVFKFADPRGATILVELYDPPLDISSPAKLRAAMLAQFGKSQQLKLTESGKLLQFNARGNRIGAFCEFDLTGAQIQPTHQYIAYLRAGSRGALAILSAPQAIFPDYATPFQQAITRISLRDPKSETTAQAAAKTEARKFSGESNTFMILGNVALIVVVLLGAFRGSRAE